MWVQVRVCESKREQNQDKPGRKLDKERTGHLEVFELSC